MDQQMFDRTLNVFRMVIKWLFKLLIYTPVFFTSFIIVFGFMKEETSSLPGLAVILLTSFILYQAIYFLKGMMIALRMNRKFIWVLIFIVCVAFTCVLPVYIVFEPIGRLITGLSKSHKPNKILTWIFSLAFGLYVYYRYNFLENLAPKMAFHAYQAGINTANRLLRLTQRISSIRSREPF